jgi:DNA replication and repair protein RecF
VALFGPNGAGKTNLMEAVSLLSPGRGLRRATADEIIRRPEAVGWKVTRRLAGWPASGTRSRLTAEPDAGPAPSGSTARPRHRSRWPGSPHALAGAQRMDRLWIEGAEGRRRFLDRMTMSFLPDHADAVLTYEKAMRERNRLLKDEVRDPAWYGALERQMAEAGAAMATNRRDALRGSRRRRRGAETAFPAADLSLIAGGRGTGPPDARPCRGAGRNRPRDMAAGRTLVGPHRADLGAFTRQGRPRAPMFHREQKALLISLSSPMPAR